MPGSTSTAVAATLRTTSRFSRPAQRIRSHREWPKTAAERTIGINTYFDIETGPLPLADRILHRPTEATIKWGALKDPVKRQKKLDAAIEAFDAGDGCALSPMTGQVLVIGLVKGGKDVEFIHGGTEADMLCEFWREVDVLFGPVIGFNSNSFDVPFLVKRSWILGVDIPVKSLEDALRRYPQHWMDLRERWNWGDKYAPGKLSVICGTLGITVKDSPVDAAVFWLHWAKEPETCLEYLRQDVEAVRQFAGRIGVPGAGSDAAMAMAPEPEF